MQFVTDLDEVLKDRLNTLKADCDRAQAALERAKQLSTSPIQIEPALIERFGFRKAYMQSIIDVIEVDDSQIRIKGSKDVLEKAVIASQNREAECSQVSTNWRAGRDSNP